MKLTIMHFGQHGAAFHTPEKRNRQEYIACGGCKCEGEAGNKLELWTRENKRLVVLCHDGSRLYGVLCSNHDLNPHPAQPKQGLSVAFICLGASAGTSVP